VVEDSEDGAGSVADWRHALLGLIGTLLRREPRVRAIDRADEQAALRAILEIAPFAIVAWAGEGTIVLWSRGAERIFGWRRSEVEGGLSPFATSEHAAEEASLLQRILAGNEIRGLPLRRRDRQGTLRDLLLDAAPLRGPGDHVVGGVSVLQEQADVRRSEANGRENRTLPERTAELAGKQSGAPLSATPGRADSAHATLLSRITHDLRQPLLALGLLSGALERRTQDPDSRELVGDLCRLVRSLQGAFENIAEWTRLESGLVAVAPSRFPAADVLSSVAQEFAVEAAQRGLDLRLVPSGAVIACDRAALQRILRHFLENALKFTAHGKILLGARRRGSMLRVIVADTGFGISEDRQDDVFDAYCQLEAGRQAGGVGLGLAIARRLAHLSAMTVGARSLSGKGSQFWVDVPRAEASSQ
jgi:PAS domain S-box-containing protein